MIHLYSKTNQEKKIENTLLEIRKAGLKFDSITYRYALLAYEVTSKVNKMYDLLIDMQKNQVPMDIMILKIYLRTFVTLDSGKI